MILNIFIYRMSVARELRKCMLLKQMTGLKMLLFTNIPVVTLGKEGGWGSTDRCTGVTLIPIKKHLVKPKDGNQGDMS